MTHAAHGASGDAIVLADVADELIADLPNHDSGRTSRTVLTGTIMRGTVIALAEGAEMGEHQTPAAATLYVITGRIRLRHGGHEQLLETGQLAPVPRQRHVIDADGTAVFLLTVALH